MKQKLFLKNLYLLFALMQIGNPKGLRKKNQARPDAPPAGQAHAHEQSLYFVFTSLIEGIGRTPCFVLFETQIGAVIFACIHLGCKFF